MNTLFRYCIIIPACCLYAGLGIRFLYLNITRNPNEKNMLGEAIPGITIIGIFLLTIVTLCMMFSKDNRKFYIVIISIIIASWVIALF